MFNRIQADELINRTKIAIGCTYKNLSFDKKEDLLSLVLEETINYDPTQATVYYIRKIQKAQTQLQNNNLSAKEREDLTGVVVRSEKLVANPDPVPCVEFLKTLVRRCASRPENEIFVVGQRIADKENAELDAIEHELKLDGETSRHSNRYQTVSYEEYSSKTGWEPSTPSIEAQIIEFSEQTVFENDRDRKVAVLKASPIFPGLLQLATDHFREGGNMKSFGKKYGMSGQTAINRIQRFVKEANDPSKPLLPFVAVEGNVKEASPQYVIKKRVKAPVKAVNTEVQPALFD